MDSQPAAGLPLQPLLLLMLKEQPGYGYELAARLQEFGNNDELATIYRALRALEHAGAVVSYWDTAAAGPARRVYRLSSGGEATLEAMTDRLAQTHVAIERLLCRLSAACNGQNSTTLAPASQ